MAAAVTGPLPSANALKFREAMEQLVWDKTDGQRCLGGPACFGESKKGSGACMEPGCTYEPTAVDVDNAWVYWFPTTKRAGSSTGHSIKVVCINTPLYTVHQHPTQPVIYLLQCGGLST